MEKTTELLYEEQERLLTKLKELDPGSKEYQAVREDVERVGNLLNKTNETEINTGLAIEAQELNETNAESDRKWNKIKTIGGIIVGVGGLILEGCKLIEHRISFIQGIDFEKDNTPGSFFAKEVFKGPRK